MSIFAGIFRRGAGALDDRQCAALRGVLSRYPGETVYEYRSTQFYLAKADIGAFAPPRPLDRTAHSVFVVAGETIVAEGDEDCQDPSTEMRALHDRFDAGDLDALRHAQGTFCGAYYNEQAHALTLFSDKLAVRPIYYWLDDDLCVFATALRILVDCRLFKRRLDLRGLAEVATLHFPLGDRTAYDGVRTIFPAEMIRIGKDEKVSRRYWQWEDCPPLTTSDIKQEVHRRFVLAVKRRLRGDRTVKATLSGGLDSRSVVGALHSLGTNIITFNFSLESSLDQVLGRECARRLGTTHYERIRTRDARDRAEFSKFLLQRCKHESGEEAERPAVIWTGEGGSVGLGHVYMDEEMISLARRNDMKGLLNRLPIPRIPRRILQDEVADTFVNAPRKGALEELQPLHCADPGRNVYLYFLANDQRRHVAGFYEVMDQRRYELQMPFYDAYLLSAIVAAPIDGFLRHAFYNEWLKLFAAPVWEVAWQAYPGHVPCPHDIPQGLIYQWAEEGRDQLRAAVAKQGWDILSSSDFPSEILKKRQILLSYFMQRFLGREQEYVFNIAEKIREHWRNTD